MIAIQEIKNLDDRLKYNQKLLDFEKLFRYPLGSDYFQIDHGKDYFHFFDRLGKPYFFIAEKNEQIVAVCVTVLREIKIEPDFPHELIWYLCDLKIHPDYQGHFIVQRILKYVFLKCSKIGTRVYTISMNNGWNNPNKIINFAQRISYLKVEFKETLNFYLFHSSHGIFLQTFLEKNENYFISLRGVKDLILQSTGRPLSIMHFLGYTMTNECQAGTIHEDMKYMICCPQKSKQTEVFQKNNLYPMATASVIANFTPNNWDFIKSSDI